MSGRITPREQAQYLAGVIKANEERARHLSDTIGSLTQAMYACNQTVLDARAELRVLQRDHYADLEGEAAAWAKDQADKRADDFRDGSAA